jgi:hypothetical protein
VSGGDHPRKPLVLCGTRQAIEQAERMLPVGVVLENLVADAITRGDVIGGASRDGGECPVLLHEHRAEVRVRRTRSPLTGRKCWIPVEVRPLAGPRSATSKGDQP